MAIVEMNHLFDSDHNSFIAGNGSVAVAMKFENWISTPKGSMWGRPEWGHTLRKFLHEPPTDTLAMIIETELVATLAVDIPEVSISYVQAQPSHEDDCYRLMIGYAVPQEGLVGEFETTYAIGSK